MRSEQDGAIERVVRDGPGGRSRDRVKPMSGSLTLLFTLSACREAAGTLQAIVALGLLGPKAVSGPAGASEFSSGTSGLLGLSQHRRASETTIASMRAGQSRSLGSAPPLCTASRRVAVASLRSSRRRQ